jgi:hypothetical protein
MPAAGRASAAKRGCWDIEPGFGAGGKRFAVFTMPETPGGEKGLVHVTFSLNFLDERLPG